MCLDGCFEIHVVVIAVVVYVLYIIFQIVAVSHFMKKCGGQLEDGPVKVLGAGGFCGTSRRLYSRFLKYSTSHKSHDRRPRIQRCPASKSSMVEMLVEQVNISLGFYNFRYL